MREAVSVRVPASSANLGPGFDSLGLALTLYDRIHADVSGDSWTVEVDGHGSGSVALNEDHLVARAMSAAFDLLGQRPAGVRLHCVNAIPHSRGMGSSAAAITGGIVAARALVDGHERLDNLGMYQLASDLEGHSDNVAAALFGGLTIAWTDGAAASVHRLAVESDITMLVPPNGVATSHARDLLPDTVGHADASANAARAALLVAALQGNRELLLPATEDRLHQAQRATAMPESHKLVRQLRVEQIPAVVSGAGPAVLAFGHGIGDFAPDDWSVHELQVDATGATVE